jgi:hypothetical protein
MGIRIGWAVTVVAVAAAVGFAAHVAAIRRRDAETPSVPPEAAAKGSDVRETAAPAPSPTAPSVVEAPPAATSEATSVRFVVTFDGDDPRPIEGASIKLRPRDGPGVTITTGAAGIARFDAPASLMQGCEAIVTSSWCPSPATMLLNVDRDGDVRIRLHDFVGMTGRVLDGATDAPIAGARIKACQKTAETNADGAFVIDRVWDDKPIYGAIEAPGHAAVRFKHDARSGPLTMWLDPAGRVVGTVREPDGTAVALVDVRASTDDGDEFAESPWTTSDETGAFILDGLVFGKAYELRAVKKGESVALTDGVVATAAAPSVVRDLVTGVGASLAVVVRDPTGRGVPDAVVRVNRGDSYQVGKGRTGVDGSIVVKLAVPGHLTVHVWSDRFAESSVDMDVAKDESKRIEVRLPPSVDVAGVVVDDVGRPVGGATLSVLAPSEFQNWGQCGCTRPGPFLETKTADDGSFRAALPRRAGLEFDLTASGHVLPGIANDASDGYSFGMGRKKYPLLPDAVPLRLVLPRATAFAFTPRFPPAIARDRSVVRAFDADGAAVFGDVVWNERRFVVPCTARRLTFRTWELVREARDVLPVAGAETDLGEIAFDRGVPLLGRVVDDVGRPIRFATFFISQEGPDEFREMVGRDDGTFEISGVPPGPVEMTIEAPGYVRAKRHVAAGGRADPIVVTLDGGASVIVRVLDASGRAADHETLAVFGPGGVVPDATLGRTTIGLWEGRLPVGSWRLVASRGDVTAETTIDVAAGPSRVFTIRLPR